MKKHMKEKIIFYILVILVTICSSFAYNLQLVDSDFNVENIYLGQPISKALSILGKPVKIKKASINDECKKYYYFPQMTIGESRFYINKVGYICIFKKGIKTFRGLEIGDNESDVINRYGKVVKSFDSLSYEKDYEPAYTKGISFVISEGKIKEIIISFRSTT